MIDRDFASFGTGEYPPEAICAVEKCGHRFDAHGQAIGCEMCDTNKQRGFDVEQFHRFVPRKLAGGALTPSQEQENYQKALRGEL